MPLLIIKLGIEREFGHADNSIHRRTQLVTHIGHEITARPISGLGRFPGGQRFGFRLSEVLDIAVQQQHASWFVGRITGNDRPLEEQPFPVPFAGFQPAFGLKKTRLALYARRHRRIEGQQIIVLNQSPPADDGVIQIIIGIAKQHLPLLA